MLGHYRDHRVSSTAAPELHHRDWLTSGSDFGQVEFTALMDAIATGMLNAH